METERINMVISSAVKQKNNPDMIQIYIDGVYSFTMPAEVYYKMNLYERKEISQEDMEYIKEEVNLKLARQLGIKMLALRDHSGSEIRNKLLKKGFDNETVDKTLMQLMSMGYINDSLYARKYISDRLKLKPRSKKALFHELKRKGIDDDIIEEALSETELDEFQLAYRLAKKKYGKYNAREPEVQRKIASFLGHRGFSYDIICKTIKQMMEK
jgi:regulatory protein